MRYNLFLAIFLVLLIFLSGCTSQNNSSQQSGNQQAAGQGSSTDSSLQESLGKKIKYSADYTITSSGQTQTMTELFDLPKYVIIMQAASGETRSIFDGTDFIVCNNMQGFWTCYKMNTQTTTESEDVKKKVDEGATITKIGTCSRAGESGTKYEITYNGVTTKVCYTSDGIMLETETSTVTMYATKVSRSIDSSLFTPPVQPQDFSSLIPH
jgi:hypothetical protein